MELESRIESIKTKALKKIERAAKVGNIKEISYFTEIVEEINRIADELKKFEAKIDEIEKRFPSDTTQETESKQTAPTGTAPQKNRVVKSPTPKASNTIAIVDLEKERRRSFIKEIRTFDINLIYINEIVYKTEKDNIIGIPYSIENASTPNEWNITLPFSDYDFIVCICERKNSEILHFVFPDDFIKSYINALSRTDDNNMKFKIIDVDNKQYLKMQDDSNINISMFLNDLESLIYI
ncbi:MAG: hypothetical protein HQK76_10400 [Desulfobacterales bacterium]|nr:hypothetical protein [Desulfobacterales bacterium]